MHPMKNTGRTNNISAVVRYQPQSGPYFINLAFVLILYTILLIKHLFQSDDL